MHLRIRRPSPASLTALLTTVAVVALCGCAEWNLQTRAEAADRFIRAGDYARAVAAVLPFPWAIPAAGLTAVAGHLAATVLRRGQDPTQPTAPKNAKSKG